jgi:hypothetical protein
MPPPPREVEQNWPFIPIALGLLAILALCVAFVYFRQGPRTDIVGLRERLDELTTERLRAKTANVNADTSALDRQIKELRGKLAPLEEREDEDRRRAAAEAEAQRLREEAQRVREEESNFRRQCKALKEKRISDLTVNDVETLRQCGTSVPLPAIP